MSPENLHALVNRDFRVFGPEHEIFSQLPVQRAQVSYASGENQSVTGLVRR